VDIEAIAFDVNGTLINIETDDGAEEIFRAAGHFLTYQGIDLRRHEVRELYFRTLRQQKAASPEVHPEFDAVSVWRSIINDHMTEFTRGLPSERLGELPVVLAQMYRGISRRRLKLYPHVRKTLKRLREQFPLAIVSDAQSLWARGELHKVGITDYFQSIVISGDHGFRKPDPRLFQLALDGLGTAAARTLYVGNDMHRDIWGAQQLGMPTVMFDSDQGTKEHKGCRPDATITDFRDLLSLV
jgi:putative hydrolase of the HAD superfamily